MNTGYFGIYTQKYVDIILIINNVAIIILFRLSSADFNSTRTFTDRNALTCMCSF